MPEPCYPNPVLPIVICPIFLNAVPTFSGHSVVTRTWVEGEQGGLTDERFLDLKFALLKRLKIFTSEHSYNLLLTCRALFLLVSGRWHLNLQWVSPVGVWLRDDKALNLDLWPNPCFVNILKFAWSFVLSFAIYT